MAGNNDCEEKAVKLLKVRDYSSLELKNTLEKKGFSPGEAEDTTRSMKELGFIDEPKQVERIIEKYTAVKPESVSIIRKRLEEKGYESQTIDSQLSKVNEKETAMRAMKLKIKKGFTDKGKRSAEAGLAAYLYAKGFEYDIIEAVISTLKEDSD